MRKPYPTDLSDTEWICLRSYLPTPKAQGRPRTHSLRDVLNTIFYVLKSGCPWRLLPHDFPPWSSVYYHFRKLRLLTAPVPGVDRQGLPDVRPRFLPGPGGENRDLRRNPGCF